MPLPAVQDQQLATALSRSETLGSLLHKVRESKLRLQAVAGLLPMALMDHIRAGPIDDTAWVLLVDHNAAAAKLRQMLPLLSEGLNAAGWPERTIRIKVLPRA
jgi:hypothetical protein